MYTHTHNRGLYSRKFPLGLQVQWLLMETLVSLSLWVGKSIHVMLRLSLLSTGSAVPMETGKELELGPQHTVQLQHPMCCSY